NTNSNPTAAPASGGANGSSKQRELTNYEVSKSVRHIVEPIGQVRYLSVAAIIDNHTKTVPGSDRKPNTTTEPRSAEEINKYKDLIGAAVGFNAERGDKITVENISFENELETPKEPTFIERQGPVIVTGVRYLVIPIV